MDNSNSRLFPYLLLSVFALAVLLPGLFSLPLVDRDAAHFAQASRQMLETGNYWQINFQDSPRHLKPPGIYWLQTLFVKEFSSSEQHTIWPYRLPSILGGFLSIILTFFFARKFYSQRIAMFAAGFLGSSLLLSIESHLVVTDAVLLATMVLMQGALWQIYVKSRRHQTIPGKWILIFWLAMAAGILIKGITPLVGFLTLFTLAMGDRDLAIFRDSKIFSGLALVVFCSFIWLIPISLNSHSNFLGDMLRGDILPKLVGGQESHGMPPGYFLVIFTLMFWSGALFVWRGNMWAWQQRHQPIERFLLAWILPTWIFFELVPTKLPEYILPTYPAMAILIAKAIVDSQQIIWRQPFILFNKIQGFIWVLYGLILLGLVVYIPFYLTNKISILSLIMACLLLLIMVYTLMNVYRDRLQQAAVIIILGSILVFSLIWQWLLPTLKPLWLSQDIVNTIHRYGSLSAEKPLLSIGYQEPSLVFLTDTHQILFVDPQQAILKLKHHSTEFVLVNSKLLQQFLQLSRESGVKLSYLIAIKGYDYSRGRWVQLNLFQKEEI